MWNDYLNFLGCSLSFIGTCLSVFSILKMSTQDIWNTNTIGHLKEMPRPTLIQVTQARCGILLVFLSLILQTVSIFFKNVSAEIFVMTIFCLSLLAFTLTLLILKEYKRANDYINRMKEEEQKRIDESRKDNGGCAN